MLPPPPTELPPLKLLLRLPLLMVEPPLPKLVVERVPPVLKLLLLSPQLEVLVDPPLEPHVERLPPDVPPVKIDDDLDPLVVVG